MRYSMHMGEVATPLASGAVTLQTLQKAVERFEASLRLLGAGPGLSRCDHPGSFVSCSRRGRSAPNANLPEIKSGAGRLIEDALIACRPTCRDALKGNFSAEDRPINAWDEVGNVKLTPAFLPTPQLGRLAVISASYVQIINVVLMGPRGSGHELVKNVSYSTTKDRLVNFTRACRSVGQIWHCGQRDLLWLHSESGDA
jgi:hypothetical protein